MWSAWRPAAKNDTLPTGSNSSRGQNEEKRTAAHQARSSRIKQAQSQPPPVQSPPPSLGAPPLNMSYFHQDQQKPPINRSSAPDPESATTPSLTGVQIFNPAATLSSSSQHSMISHLQDDATEEAEVAVAVTALFSSSMSAHDDSWQSAATSHSDPATAAPLPEESQSLLSSAVSVPQRAVDSVPETASGSNACDDGKSSGSDPDMIHVRREDTIAEHLDIDQSHSGNSDEDMVKVQKHEQQEVVSFDEDEDDSNSRNAVQEGDHEWIEVLEDADSHNEEHIDRNLQHETDETLMTTPQKIVNQRLSETDILEDHLRIETVDEEKDAGEGDYSNYEHPCNVESPQSRSYEAFPYESIDMEPSADSFENESRQHHPLVETVSEQEGHEEEYKLTVKTNMVSPSAISDSSPRTMIAALSEGIQLPEVLSRVEETTYRSRQEFLTRVHDLECQIASITAKLTHESLDREKQLSTFLQENVHQPLVDIRQDLYLEQESHRSARNNTKTWLEMNRDLAMLDARMTHDVYVSLHDAKKEQLDSQVNRLEREVIPNMQLELAQDDKAEGILVGRFETLAGTMGRRYHEEHAARVAATSLADQAVQNLNDEEMCPKRAQEFLQHIRDLRRQLGQEREIRKAEDERLMLQIGRAYASLQRSVLQVIGDDDEDACE